MKHRQDLVIMKPQKRQGWNKAEGKIHESAYDRASVHAEKGNNTLGSYGVMT